MREPVIVSTARTPLTNARLRRAHAGRCEATHRHHRAGHRQCRRHGRSEGQQLGGFLGATPKTPTTATAAPNHSPAFDFDEDAMAVGAKALSALAIDFLQRP